MLCVKPFVISHTAPFRRIEPTKREFKSLAFCLNIYILKCLNDSYSQTLSVFTNQFSMPLNLLDGMTILSNSTPCTILLCAYK